MLLSVSAYTGISPRGEIINDGDFLSRAQSLVGYKICYPNDLVMNIMLAWNRGLGFSNYYGIVSPAYSVFKLLPGNCTRFLDYLVRSDEAILYYKAFSSGVIDSRLRLYPNIFGSLYYALPPLAEQQAIASFLDRECGKIDGLIAEQERLIALLAEKRQAAISHAVTKGLNPNAPMKDSGIPWIGMVPEGWEMMRVKNILLTIEQGWSPQCENYPRSSDSEWAVLKVGCVNTGVFNPSENKVLPETLDGNEDLQVRVGDLLVSRANTRDLVGRSAVAERNYSHLMICDKIFRLRTRPDLCSPEYLSFFLQSSSGRHVIELAASGASQSMVNIGQGTILEMIFPVPPLETQRHILKNLNYNEEAEAIKNANRFINLARERRAALISAAVTGKIDIRAQSKALAA